MVGEDELLVENEVPSKELVWDLSALAFGCSLTQSREAGTSRDQR